jgi:hypothetical protein
MGSADLNALFAPLLETIQHVPAEKQDTAQQKVQTLQVEVAKGTQADDSRMAELIDDLIDLVPSAVSAIVSTFASPLLAGIVGPVTHFVLKRTGAK